MIRRWFTFHRQDVLIGVIAALGVAAYVIAAAVTHAVGFPLDDSWIHQTYARNLAEHGEWAFIPGQASVASTSPLFTLLLSVGYITGIPFLAWTFVLGALALAAAGWIGARLAQVVFPDMPRAGLLTGLALVLAWHLVWAAASGMETMLFCTLSLALVWCAWRELPVGERSERVKDTFGRGMVAGLVGAALTLTRPEGAGLVGLAGLFVLLAWPYEHTGNGWRLVMAWLVGVALGWLIGVLPYAALNYHVSGDLLPSTASAKQAENAPALELPLWERYGRLLLPLVPGGQLLVLPGMIAALVGLRRHPDGKRWRILFLLPLAWIVVDLSAYALRLPAPYQHGRYMIPILPYVWLYGVGGTLTIVQPGRSSLIKRVFSRSLGLSAALITLAFWWIGAQQYGRDVRIINTEMVDTAHWVKDNLPPEDLLAVHDIGALGYYAPRPILDLAGLVSPEVVPIIRDHEAIMQLMCERGARYLMVLPDQRPAVESDQRLGSEPIFITNAPYAPAAGSGNMAIYELHWPDNCAILER
ncbi:MAG: hypothetical protein JXJ20_04935 [Anaerolineae bacterium]|nr:hypothetical protein [Anaerolineae bacterium]